MQKIDKNNPSKMTNVWNIDELLFLMKESSFFEMYYFNWLTEESLNNSPVLKIFKQKYNRIIYTRRTIKHKLPKSAKFEGKFLWWLFR